LLWWSVFAAAFFLAGLSAMVLVRRQWVENEKLAYPLTALPIALAECLDPQAGKKALRSRLAWLGFCLGCLPIVWGWIRYTLPALSRLPPINLARLVTLGARARDSR